MTASETRGFDPGGYFAFDLARGAVHTRHGERVLVLASDVLGPLVSTAVRQGDLTAVRMLGKRIGEDAARSLGGDVRAATPEAVTTHANGMLSLLGWGTLQVERWGHALVLALEGAPSLDNERLGLAALLGGVPASLGGGGVGWVPVDGTRFVIVHPSVAETVWGWSKEHKDLPSIIARLSDRASTEPSA